MYAIKMISRAAKDIENLEKIIFENMKDAIDSLRENPSPPGCKKLTSKEGYRIRIGDYRIIYEIDDKNQTIYIFRIKHRKDIYR